MQTELSLHASEGCSSKLVAAYVVSHHCRKVRDRRGFGGRRGASRMAKERVGLGRDRLPEVCVWGGAGLKYSLSSKVDVKPPLQQFIGEQRYTKLR